MTAALARDRAVVHITRQIAGADGVAESARKQGGQVYVRGKSYPYAHGAGPLLDGDGNAFGGGAIAAIAGDAVPCPVGQQALVAGAPRPEVHFRTAQHRAGQPADFPPSYHPPEACATVQQVADPTKAQLLKRAFFFLVPCSEVSFPLHWQRR